MRVDGMPENANLKQYEYKFSFVMPVYNVEDYLSETIESVINQTMDFERNTEIILINDGSPDDSEKICLHYQERFPNNIRYIKQRNSGVSAARNRGIKEAKGKYISFLDSDDKLSRNALKDVYGFFESHYDEIDFVAIKLEVFDARTGGHPLNYKFHTTRIVDINEEYDSIQLHAASSFVKNEAIKKYQLEFDEDVAISEDAKFMAELVLDKMAYGITTKPTYYYRKRQSANSAIDGSMKNPSWYDKTLTKVHQELFDFALSHNGVIPKYLQYVVMYEMQWRFRQSSQEILTPQEESDYKSKLVELVKKIDDDIILGMRNLNLEEKIFVLDKKYDSKLREGISQKASKFFFNDTLLCDYAVQQGVNVHFELMSHDNGAVTIEGYFNGPLLGKSEIKIKSGAILYKTAPVSRPRIQLSFLGEKITDRHCFKVTVPLSYGTRISAYLVADGVEVELPLVARRHLRLNQTVGRAYRIYNGAIIVKRPTYLEVEKYTRKRHFIREVKYLAALLQSKQLKAIGYRLAYYIFAPFAKRDIWLLSDRVAAAGDNAEALFKYLSKNNLHKQNAYFAIDKHSKDYKSLKKYGNVVAHGSLRYKLLFLCARKIISSHADAFVTNPFDANEHNLIDLYKFDFVFLQHGITHNDISQWLNRYNKDIKLFVTAALPEYESLLSNDYSYDKSVVKLTGFPRYDVLENEPKGKIILAPTWRKNIVGPLDVKSSTRLYNESFTKTEYYKFYSKLMEDDRIQRALKENKMIGEFYLHPSLSAQIRDFKNTGLFTIKSMPYDYRTAFSEGNVLITDYSSVAFDFAYLKKPVIYTQFDKDKFYAEHTWDPGYFSYDNNGFGPVAYDYEEAVHVIVAAIESGVMAPEYQKRTSEFFYKFDKRNCERVYKEIVKTGKS